MAYDFKLIFRSKCLFLAKKKGIIERRSDNRCCDILSHTLHFIKLGLIVKNEIIQPKMLKIGGPGIISNASDFLTRET
jgi:hypothetical protein